jgi:hypothetical protein
LERTHLSSVLLARIIGLYVILQGVRVLLVQSRGEGVGIYKLGIFIPVTNFMILKKIHLRMLKGILTLLSCLFGLVLGAAGVGIFFTDDGAISVEVFGLVTLYSKDDLLLGGTCFILSGLLLFIAIPVLLYRSSVAQKGD